MTLAGRYELLEPVYGPLRGTYQGLELATGVPVVIHLLGEAGDPEGDRRIEQIEALSAQAKRHVVEFQPVGPERFLVTDRTCGYLRLRDWLVVASRPRHEPLNDTVDISGPRGIQVTSILGYAAEMSNGVTPVMSGMESLGAELEARFRAAQSALQEPPPGDRSAPNLVRPASAVSSTLKPQAPGEAIETMEELQTEPPSDPAAVLEPIHQTCPAPALERQPHQSEVDTESRLAASVNRSRGHAVSGANLVLIAAIVICLAGALLFYLARA